jgi:hypothetical protein
VVTVGAEVLHRKANATACNSSGRIGRVRPLRGARLIRALVRLSHKPLGDQPANSYGARRFIGLRATPAIDGMFEIETQPEGQDRILPDRRSPTLFSYYEIRVRHGVFCSHAFCVLRGFEFDMAALSGRLDRPNFNLIRDIAPVASLVRAANVMLLSRPTVVYRAQVIAQGPSTDCHP